MDTRSWAQDVLRCHLCETPVPSMYCDICHIHMCKACVGEHLSDLSSDHKVMLFKLRVSSLKCQEHSSKICESYCEQCDIPICDQCVSSKVHKGHEFVDTVKGIKIPNSVLERDLKELENFIYPTYQAIASNIFTQKADLFENSKKLTRAINKQDGDLRREIDIITKELKSDLQEMDSNILTVLNKHENVIASSIFGIRKSIADLKLLLISNDEKLVSTYKSRNAEFKKLPPKLQLSLPCFTPQKINTMQLDQQFGSLSMLPKDAEKQTFTNYTNNHKSEDRSNSKDILQSDKPEHVTEINTVYGQSNGLCSMSCLSDEEIWMCGNDKIMRLYNLNGVLRKSIETKSGNIPDDITLTKSGDLVYTDGKDRSINVANNTQTKKLITLQGWKPRSVCSTISGDLLVVMDNDHLNETKVVRYSGSREKQSIQYNDKGQPLFSSGYFYKYISENSNSDICVSDHKARAVVVVNQAGKLRFTYTGSTNRPFTPFGIATDSKSHILTADHCNNIIHILDQDGKLQCYIDKCDLHCPWGLCVDTKDNIIVSEYFTGKVKKIQCHLYDYCIS